MAQTAVRVYAILLAPCAQAGSQVAIPMNIGNAPRITPVSLTKSDGPVAAPMGHPDAPSVQAILGALRQNMPMTGADIRQVSGLPRRTVYTALRTLRERGVLRQRQSLQDTRQTYFWLVDLPSARPSERLALDSSEPSRPAVSVR